MLKNTVWQQFLFVVKGLDDYTQVSIAKLSNPNQRIFEGSQVVALNMEYLCLALIYNLVCLTKLQN